MGLIASHAGSALGADESKASISRGILHARIVHVRHGQKRYAFRHRTWFLSLPLSAVPRLNRSMIGYNKIRPFSLRSRDYGTGAEPLETWVQRAFSDAGVEMPGGETVLLTLPRVFGIGFNPVSFWLCHNPDGRLTAVLAEVNNTFGERHCYLVRKPDGSRISAGDELCTEKVFHVSPFLPVEGEYAFRFAERGNDLAIRIDLRRAGELVLTAAINGRYATLSNASLLACFVRYPLPAVQVLGFIHYHAVRLYLRGFKYFPKPPPPKTLVSGALDLSNKREGLKPYAP